MTEQEKREKAIEEIESDLCNGCKYYKGKDLCCICEVEDYAKTLVDLHYRKEEEVRKEERKETARTILSAWKQISRSYDSGETQKKSFERINRLAELYDIEVEE